MAAKKAAPKRDYRRDAGEKVVGVSLNDRHREMLKLGAKARGLKVKSYVQWLLERDAERIVSERQFGVPAPEAAQETLLRALRDLDASHAGKRPPKKRP